MSTSISPAASTPDATPDATGTSGASALRVAAIIGAGTMGAGVAAAFLAGGWAVELVEPIEAPRASAARRVGALLPPATDAAAALARLRVHATLAEVDWPAVRFVSESVFEDLDTKRRVFAELVALAPPGVPLTSNSTTLFAADIGAGLPRADSILNAHFLMPADVVPLVEVLATPEVAPDAVERTCEALQSIGKMPVRLGKAMRGFLVNRVQSALMREALALVDAGVASPQDVDTAVRFGFGFRYAACGPMLQKEHSGWDTSLKMYQAVFPTLSNNTEPPQVTTRMVGEGRSGMKTGEGFARWTPEAMATERARFVRDMQAALALVRGRPDDVAPDWREG